MNNAHMHQTDTGSAIDASGDIQMHTEYVKESDWTFATEQEAANFIVARARVRFAAPEEALAHLERETAIALKEEYRPSLPPGAAPMLLKHFRWVIKNDDLALLDCILDGARASAPLCFSLINGRSMEDPALWAAVAGIAAAVFKVCRNVVRKGNFLEPKTYAVLVALKALGPLDEKTLLGYMKRSDHTWNLKAIRGSLSSLKSMPMSNGEPRQLVAQNSQRRWAVAGV